MKLAIIGTREPSISYNEFCKIVKREIKLEITEIISGGAKGIDTYASRYAREHRIFLKELLPEYSKFGKRATLVRNTQIVENADVVLALPSESSKGTLDGIKKAKKLNKSLYIVHI